MAELEKVIKGLEHCANNDDCRGCDYFEEYSKIIHCGCSRDALELLKKLKQKETPVIQSDGSCPNCKWEFESGDLDFSNLDSQKFYCPNCGQAVKWE